MLPRLLDSIKAQDFDGYEIVVADAHSTDKTREIAAAYDCHIVDGGLPAVGRNAGAAVAQGEFLFFLDADVVLPKGFLRNVYDEMQDRYFDLATCEIRPLSDYRLDRVIHRMINLAVLLNLRMDPKAFGFCIFVTRRLFRRIGGFDETIYVAEDNDFVKRASDFSTLRYLRSAHIRVSIRRFEKEGRLAYMKKGIKLNLHRTFIGEIRNDEVVKYEFDNFDKPETETKEDRDFLDWVERRLIRFEKVNIDDSRHLQPKIEEFSHLIEDLEVYMDKKERRVQRLLKWKNFFKPRRRRA